MKKFLYLFIAVFAVTSCQKDPDMGDLSDDYVVFTTNDPDYFTATTTPSNPTVFIPAAIREVQADGTPVNWDDANAQSIINVFRTNLAAMNYDVTAPDAASADLVLNLTYAKDVTIYVDYPTYWWWDGYWPYWYYPYPYPYVYGYAVASIVGELIQPGVVESDTTNPVVWNAFVGGYDYGNKAVDTPYFVKGAQQAFNQSPYLERTAAPVL